MVLAGVKVLPKVEPFSLVLADEEVNVGLRDKVLHLSLESHVVRILFFRSIKSTSVALNSSSELRHKTS